MGWVNINPNGQVIAFTRLFGVEVKTGFSKDLQPVVKDVSFKFRNLVESNSDVPFSVFLSSQSQGNIYLY